MFQFVQQTVSKSIKLCYILEFTCATLLNYWVIDTLQRVYFVSQISDGNNKAV